MEACMAGNEFIYGHRYTVFFFFVQTFSWKARNWKQWIFIARGKEEMAHSEEIVLAFIHGYRSFPICGYLWKAVLSETNLKLTVSCHRCRDLKNTLNMKIETFFHLQIM